MKGVLNMRMKKGIITVSTIAVVILGVFFAVRFIGGRENATNIKPTDDSIVQTDNSTPKSNSEVLTNENEESNPSASVTQEEVESTQGQNTNEMDAAYINDKTNVGIYTVKEKDTVFSIAKAYMPSHPDKNKVVEFIETRNSIEKDRIKVGQKLVIPYEKAIETSTAVDSKVDTNKYTIKENDTLTSIAKNIMPSYNPKHAVEMLKQENKIINENDIKAGTVISIPKE
jgi:LysM repeat protein